MAKVDIHMVRSVKGGSGKTAFALRKIVDLTRVGKNVLYIDADVHASGTFSRLYKMYQSNTQFDGVEGGEGSFFFQFINASSPNEIGNRLHFLNTFIHPYRGYYSKLEEIMLSASLKELTLIGSADGKYQLKEDKKQAFEPKFVFSDPSREGRDVFGNIFQSSGRAAIGVGTYIAKMKNLLLYALEQRFTDIVVDMPPGSDTFSEHLADLITSLSGSKHKLSIYYVTTKDLSHLRTSTEAAVAHLHQMKSAYIDEIILVCNEGRDDQPSIIEESKKADKPASGQEPENDAAKQSDDGEDDGKVGGFRAEATTDISDTRGKNEARLSGCFVSKTVLKKQIQSVCSDCSNSEMLDDELRRINYKVFWRDRLYYDSQRNSDIVTLFDGSNTIIADLPEEE